LVIRWNVKIEIEASLTFRDSGVARVKKLPSASDRSA
jgi:hypothetical protein